MLFLIAYYRFLGVIAALALIVYAILLYAVVVLVPITMTLPGIAGIILTIGVASDANVVIFERVQRGGALRQIAARRHPRGLQEGHLGDHRRQRRDAGDRRDPVPVRDGRRQGLRLHALRRRDPLAVHGGRRHAGRVQRARRDPLPARRPLPRPQPARDPLEDGLRRQVEALDGDLVRPVPGRRDRDRRRTASTSASTSRAAPAITTQFEQQPSEDAVRGVFSDLGYGNAKIQSFTEEVDGERGPRLPDADRDAAAGRAGRARAGSRRGVRDRPRDAAAGDRRRHLRRPGDPQRDLGHPAQLRRDHPVPDDPVRVQARDPGAASRWSTTSAWRSRSTRSPGAR